MCLFAHHDPIKFANLSGQQLCPLRNLFDCLFFECSFTFSQRPFWWNVEWQYARGMMFVIVCGCACGTSQRCTTCNIVPLDLVVMADKAAVGSSFRVILSYVTMSPYQFSNFSGVQAFFRILVPKKLFYNGGNFMMKLFTFGSLMKSWQFTLLSEHIHASVFIL